jgi:hypothetical protein
MNIEHLDVRPAVPLWALLPGHNDLHESLLSIARRALTAVQSRRRVRRRKFYLRSIFAPLIVLPIALRCLWRYGGGAKRTAGIGYWQQLGLALSLALRHQIGPLEFYQLALYRPERLAKAASFVPSCQLSALIEVANEGPKEWDKRWFAQRCREFSLPHVPIIAVFEDGQPPIAPEALPWADLFVKPANQGRGEGTERWHWRDGFYESDGVHLSASELVDHLQDTARRQPHLVQPRLINHLELQPLTNGALATLRILTGRQMPSTAPQFILAALRIPHGRMIVDNMAAGGLVAPVDTTTGRLGAAVSKDPVEPCYELHPDTHARVRGQIVPFWPDCVALATSAHRAFAAPALIGWDIAVTEQGPVLIEGNLASDVRLLQMAHGVPLADTLLAPIVLGQAETGSLRQIA